MRFGVVGNARFRREADARREGQVAMSALRGKREVKEANDIRTKAFEVCSDPEAARAAWLKVLEDGRCHGKTARAARLAMLQALADGCSVREAKRAALAVLA